MRGEPGCSALLAGPALVVAALVVLSGSAVPARLLSVGKPIGVSAAATPGRGLELLPLSARSVVSATLGAESSVFAARRSGAGYRLGGGGVGADLSVRGVSLRADGVSLAMTLAGVGRGGRLERPGLASVGARGNRVSLERAGLSEWYAAGPLGIEQGFTLSRRPAGTGPVTLALQLTGNARSHRAASGTVSLSRPGQASLSYGALSATDANGRPLRAALAAPEGRLLIRVWDSSARYPLLIDPLIQQGAKLTGSGETGAGRLGVSVALSADGNTALIGGNNDNSFVGAAWVFTRTAGVWTQQGAKLTGSGEVGGGLFGWSAAVSSDGNTALIGGLGDNGSVGAAWVFMFGTADLPATTTCTRTITGTVVANINVLSGTTCLKDLTMQGSVTVAPGAALSIINATIGGGPIKSSGASAITICNSRIGGPVNVLSSTGYVLIGDGGDGPAHPNNCAANIFGSTVTLLANAGGLEVGGNTVGDSLSVLANAGSLPIEDKATEIEGNTINANLICLGNAAALTNDNLPNTVLGSRVGPQASCGSAGF